jgi:hypothetical protein
MPHNRLATSAMGIAVFLVAPALYGQRISVGVVAGGYANSDFVSSVYLFPGFNPDITVSEKGGYFVGPTVEVDVTRRLSVVSDALYKPLHYKKSATFFPDGSIGYAPATVVTWQFPVLMKYHFTSIKLRPFLEGGPSFRSAGNLNQTNPSNYGVSAGLGIEGRWRVHSLAPSIRYTRWAKDRYPSSYDVQTRSDQVEFQFRVIWRGLRR